LPAESWVEPGGVLEAQWREDVAHGEFPEEVLAAGKVDEASVSTVFLRRRVLFRR
jgi:hypothetical protein